MNYKYYNAYNLCGLLQIFVSIFGVIGNSLCAVVLTRPEMRSSFNVLLFGLALVDNIYLVTQDILQGIPGALRFISQDLSYFYHADLYPYAYFWNTFGNF